jgi:hypothetical protein
VTPASLRGASWAIADAADGTAAAKTTDGMHHGAFMDGYCKNLGVFVHSSRRGARTDTRARHSINHENARQHIEEASGTVSGAS